MKDFDIANIAESILKTESKQGKLVSTPKGIIRPNGPDISKVTVPAKYTKAILENSFGKTVDVEEINEEESVEASPKNPEVYVKELMRLIQEAKELINEMTSCGSIGTNMAGKIGFTKRPKIKKKLRK